MEKEGGSGELSRFLYYAFRCHPSTCATCQITQRTWNSLINHYQHLIYGSNQQYGLGTGSLYEGTSINVSTDSGNVMKSDVDHMYVDMRFEVYPIGCLRDYDSTKYCLQMKTTKHTRSGYCVVESVGEKRFDRDSFITNSQKQLLDYTDRSNFVNQGESTGPAIGVVEMFTPRQTNNDAVFCYKSRKWPAECRNWSDLIIWPSLPLQNAIKREGFHIVRTGHPLGPERVQEWRLSFSVAEKMLIHSFNSTQLTCAVVMKLLLNYYIKPVVPDSINSYHIKTLMLWSVEEDIHKKWEPQYFIQCLTNLLTKLMKYISDRKLQHYFIPDNNLFEYKVTSDNQKILLREVQALWLSVLKKCTSLLKSIGISVSPSKYPVNLLQNHCLKNVAFQAFNGFKTCMEIFFSRPNCTLTKHTVGDWMKAWKTSQPGASLASRIISVLSCNIPNLYKKLSNIWFSHFKTWCGSMLIGLYKAKLKLIINQRNYSAKQTHFDEIRGGIAIGLHLLTESYENASTTGCIRMALVHMCEGNHYHAVPLLNRALNIIDQFDNYSLYQIDSMKYNFTEHLHLYNDQQAIESALTAELLNDKVLHKTPFLWLEMNLLPRLLQLELTHTFYMVNIFTLLEDVHPEVNPFQYWNPIPLTHFLLFVCHCELLKSVTFLDPACLQDDIDNLQSLIHDRQDDIVDLKSLEHDRQRLRLDEVPSVLNLLAWCYLKMGDKKLLIKHVVKTVQESTGCDKTLFSHLFIQHVIGAVIEHDVRCIVS